MALQIVTDSSSDLPSELTKKHNIQTVPLYVNFGSSFSRPETELPREKYWGLVTDYTERTPPVYPQTSQPSRHDFELVFREILAAGDEVLCISITSGHSGTYESACAVKEEFGKGVEVFDSQFLTWGQGFMALEAAKAANNGKSIEQILEHLKDLRNRTHVAAALDTLVFLKKGGRADKIIDVLERLTSLLNLKILVQFTDGKITRLGKGGARTMQGALRKIYGKVAELSAVEKIAVVYTRNLENPERSRDRAREVKENIKTRTGFTGRIRVRETGAVLSSHAGPGAIAVVAVTKV